MSVSDATWSSSTRVTKEGRKLTYNLKVIQQPERARACGSGAKSSADRRPVDPPPVVELRIFEGEAMNDVTFSYNANFFLFATLENARPIAHGRVPQTPATSPVLTGMPVSGVAYLDRPAPAGYFLFPDLSVRHEGKYRLGFTLYEEVKEPKDADAEPARNHPDHRSNKKKILGPLAPKAHVEWRLEVKSNPFTVYSAKKFPGLAESTVLSRVVAEQGCRVRIRRDVRMRRRPEKSGRHLDEFADESEYARSRATPTPDPYHQITPVQPAPQMVAPPSHPRSPSNGSIDVAPTYNVDHRRNSLHEQPTGPYGQPTYQQAPPPAPPMAPQALANGYSHLAFGSAAGPQYASPQYSNTPSQMVQAQQGYPPPQMTYFPNAPIPQPGRPSNVPGQHSRQNSMDHPATSRRGSIVHSYSGPPTPANGFAYTDPNYARAPSSMPQYASSSPSAPAPVHRTPTPGSNGQALPPLKVPMPLEPKYESVGSPVGPTSASWPGPSQPSPSYDGTQGRNSFYGAYAGAPPPPAPSDPNRSAKRPYGAVFNATPQEQSFRNGMRPNEAQTGLEVPHVSYDEDEFDSAYELQQLKMQYKRADGTEISRRLHATA
ncbi:MAG: velvet protein [Thelocarpon superellum]|nr:MAG: velvet protein [Thelocarpon superellum]